MRFFFFFCFAANSYGWTMTTTGRSAMGKMVLNGSNKKDGDDERSSAPTSPSFNKDILQKVSFDDQSNVILATKTKKNIVYDDDSGRFFEFGKDSPNALLPTAAAAEEKTYTVPPEFSLDDMIPTEILFQNDIAKRLKLKNVEEEEERTASRRKSIQKKEQEKMPAPVQSPSPTTNQKSFSDDNEMIPTEILFADSIEKRREMQILFQNDIAKRLELKNLEEEEEKRTASRRRSSQKEKEQEKMPALVQSPSPTPKRKTFSDENEMIPTEILFADDIAKRLEMQGVTTVMTDATAEKSQVFPTEMATKARRDDGEDNNKIESSVRSIVDKQQQQQQAQPEKNKSIVETCYEAWNARDMDGVVSCFSEDASYHDTQYFGTVTTRDALKTHFTQQANLLPTGSEIVLEHIAVDNQNKKIGTKWRIQTPDGSKKVPYTSGCSFYDIDKTTGLIAKGKRVSEMWIKPSKEIANLLVSSATTLWDQGEKETPSSKESSLSFSSSNIIEQYLDAWNNRDIELALACFDNDCTYQTEDPVFVNTLVGKDELREHLVQNAKSLPSDCRIVLDDVALDERKQTIATKWHLEVLNGRSIMSGISMYTITSDGLLQTGYDVTETPLKLPRALLPVLSFPAKLLFGS